MKRPLKKGPQRLRGASGRRDSYERPLEFERGWNELESRADSLRMDWGSLAAQLGISARD